MKTNFFKITILSLFIFLMSFQDQFGRVIPMKDFFKNPEVAGFEISPDGNYLAYLKPYENRLNVFVKKIGEEKEVRLTSSKDRSITNFFWKGSNRIVYSQDKGGNENFHLFSVDITGKNMKELTPFDKVTVRVTDYLEEIASEILIEMNKDNPQVFDVYRINLLTNKMDKVATNPGNITGWMTDHDGKLRIAFSNNGVMNTLLYRKTEKDEFKPVITTNFKEQLSPELFTFDNKFIYANTNIGRDKSVIIKYDIENKKELETIFEHPEVDAGGLSFSKKRKVITSANYTTWRPFKKFFDKDREDLQKNLESLLPGKNVGIAGMSKDENKMVVITYGDKSYPNYYFYDVTKKQLTKLADAAPWIIEDEMCEMKPISYQSRDGMTINGYLTLPKGVEPKNLPVIINPHGGPWARDNWGYNPEVQFLANRGYAVLQMNFRGSIGYGKKFWESSFKQWGKTMQDDISDGVKWLINQGIANPKKIGIYGASYGGYATLAGMTFTPELYACGVDYVGVSNLFTFMKTIPPYWKPFLDMMHEMVGDPVKDSVLMRNASPVFHVDKIIAPLFIAQGANDPRVNKAEADQMVEALKKRGIDVPYMVKDNEGHGFQNEENKFDFYNEMEKFLAKYLK